MSCNQYLKFARIARSDSIDNLQELIEIKRNSSLENIWIDGQRTFINYNNGNDFSKIGGGRQNVRVVGNGSTVKECRFTGSAGGSNIEIMDFIGETHILDNTITGYESHHKPKSDLQGCWWTDRVTIKASDAEVIGNMIIDPTDVGIVCFIPYINNLPDRQRSQILRNTIFASGNSAYAALCYDAMFCDWDPPNCSPDNNFDCDFSGS